jgi:hypothetical protein
MSGLVTVDTFDFDTFDDGAFLLAAAGSVTHF